MDAAKTIRNKLREIENELALIESLRMAAKTEGGRLSAFGRDLLKAAKVAGVKQAFMAKLLDITPGAVSQHYNKSR